MNELDYLILAVLGISALLSLFRGFVSEVLSLVFWILSFWMAFRLAAPVSALFSGVARSPVAQLAFAYTSLLIGFGALGGMLTWAIRRFVYSTGLRSTDRMLGLVFGILRGAVIVTALTLLGRFTTMPQDPAWRASRLLPHFDHLAQQATRLLPDVIRARIDAAMMPALLEALPAAVPAPAAATPATTPPAARKPAAG